MFKLYVKIHKASSPFIFWWRVFYQTKIAYGVLVTMKSSDDQYDLESMVNYI